MPVGTGQGQRSDNSFVAISDIKHVTHGFGSRKAKKTLRFIESLVDQAAPPHAVLFACNRSIPHSYGFICSMAIEVMQTDTRSIIFIKYRAYVGGFTVLISHTIAYSFSNHLQLCIRMRTILTPSGWNGHVTP